MTRLTTVAMDLAGIRAYTETRVCASGDRELVLVLDDGLVRIELTGGSPLADAARVGATRITSASWAFASSQTVPGEVGAL